MQYRAVIFDLFGTLVPGLSLAGYEDIVARIAGELGAHGEAFAAAWADTFDERCKGAFGSEVDSLRIVAQAAGANPSAGQLASAAAMRIVSSRAAMTPREDAAETLVKLRRQGLRIGLLSDATREIPPLWSGGTLAPLFDATVFSCDVGLRKPDARIYAAICKRVGVAAEDCLYVGDGGSNELTGAAGVGMDPVLIRAPEDPVAYRIDGEDWPGRRIQRLSEVLSLA